MLDLVIYLFLSILLIASTRIKPNKVYSILITDGTDATNKSLVLATRVLECTSMLSKKVGLLNTPNLQAGEGLLLRGVSSIHTKGMHTAIDVIFLDDTMRILKIEENLQPGVTKTSGPKGTRHTLELGPMSVKPWGKSLLPLVMLELIA
jgi:uncharacterized membrane protein (UPF0127 family)